MYVTNPRGGRRLNFLRILVVEVRSMFLDYYQLAEQPFDSALTAAQVSTSHTHCEALESSRDSILADRGSFAVIAEPGMGKTTLLSQLFESIRESVRSTFLFHGQRNSQELLRFLLSKLGVDSSCMDVAVMRNRLNAIWFAEMLAGKRFVLLFDDAENLNDSVLETISELVKYETSNTKLFQIILCGQPSLLQKLEPDTFLQLRKRLVRVQRLEPLSPMETAAYIRHRLYAAGYRGNLLFDPEAIAAVAELSGGVPQDINRICSRALLEAYARGFHSVTADIVEKAGRNLNAPAVDTPAPISKLIESQITRPDPARRERAPMQLTYAVPTRLGLPGSGLWVGAVLGVLLSAGLALPHGMLKGMTKIMHGSQTTAASSLASEPLSQLLSNPERPATDVTTRPPTGAPKQNSSEILGRTTSRLSLTRELGLKINRIVIDPGHGGFDTGAKGPRGLLEKDLCLDVALRLGQMIEENIPGAEVVYTRRDDSYVPLEGRTTIANSSDADLFISIHANSSESTEVRGVETYYLSLATSKEAKELAIRENAMTQSSLHDLPDLVKKIASNEKIAESRLLAAEIQGTLSQRLQLVSRREKNRGVKQAPFIVLTGANMPAVLSEISFVSNANDETLLLETGQRQRIADGLYHGIATYLDGLHGIPQNRQKLVTDNRTESPSSFKRSVGEIGHRPL